VIFPAPKAVIFSSIFPTAPGTWLLPENPSLQSLRDTISADRESQWNDKLFSQPRHYQYNMQSLPIYSSSKSIWTALIVQIWVAKFVVIMRWRKIRRAEWRQGSFILKRGKTAQCRGEGASTQVIQMMTFLAPLHKRFESQEKTKD